MELSHPGNSEIHFVGGRDTQGEDLFMSDKKVALEKSALFKKGHKWSILRGV